MDVANNFANGTTVARDVIPEKNIKELVQQRFKADETVHMVFEAYQIKGQEHVEGLLTLVSSSSGGTCAIISFTLRRTPLTSSNDLKINKVFPINKSFQLTKDTKGSITDQQFDLSADDDRPSKYYYHPYKTDNGTVEYEEFVALVYSFRNSMWTAELPMDTKLNFRWLDNYQEIGEVKQELKKREHQYMDYKNIIVYCATWNVNNKPCWDNNNSLRPWLARGEKAPHIYAIGIQELEATHKIIMNVAQYQSYSVQWVRKMLQSLHESEGVEYVEYRTERLAGIMLTIIVRDTLKSHISHCRMNTVARGVFNTLGNKGGVAVSLKLHEANICFINSHLAAHMGNVTERNDDYQSIENNMKFDNVGGPLLTINDHDHIFWLGDLNYRVNELADNQLVVDGTSLESRMERDQLLIEMRFGRCFKGYTEGPIRFQPTYKYDVGTDNYDSSEKQRAPAYCDRVLWKGKRIKQISYNSVMEIRQSDHKPVYAIFSVDIKKKNEAKFKKVQEEVLKEFDKRENDNQPQILAEKFIDFGFVRFNEVAVQEFNIYNNCQQQVHYQFKVKDSPNDICEKWVRIDPRSGSLMIQSASSIRVQIHADASSITGLLKKICQTPGTCDFDILILDVISGRDIFVRVMGEYQPSCFGLSMEAMCRTDRPINKYNLEEFKSLMLDKSTVYRVTMPREFFLLIDYLHKQADKIQGIFKSYDRQQTLSHQFNAVRDWLDSWSDEEFPGTPQTAAEALLLLLDLPEEALLEPQVENLLACDVEQDAMDLIEELSHPKRNVIMHLRMFLRVGIEQQYYDLNNVATIFGRILLRSSKSKVPSDYDQRCSEFMRRFIYIEAADAVTGGNSHGQAQGGASGGSWQT